MKKITGAIAAAALVGTAMIGTAEAGGAGNYNGDFLVRAGISVVNPDASADVAVNGTVLPGLNADVSTEVIPSLTLTYFLNKNLAVELFCCFAKHDAEGTSGLINNVNLGDFWIFPPALTLQYHFDRIGGIKPYVGAGVQYIAFFSEGRSALPGNPSIDLDNAFGFVLQAGVDIEIGNGWYLNADVKKTWLDTEASWGTVGGLGRVTADVDVDPWIFSANLGYRFNLSDIFGSRSASYAPMK